MRKLSYVLLALGGVVPIVTLWWVKSITRTYEQTYGVPIDGIGLLGYVGFGVLVMFALLVAAAVFAALAYQRAGRPRSIARILELIVFLAQPPVLIAFAYFVILGLGQPATKCRSLANGVTECWIPATD